jgi:hypothetical protein
MQEYDGALKSFLYKGRESLLEIASLPIERWHNVEIPELQRPTVVLSEDKGAHSAAPMVHADGG